ncbi:hypothetical protein [Cohnella luojiensis]|uniref:Uncharacterized protein n=1 Tax=Cohnella luojiensis TaxID=652876 RepID=A0A4Y8M7Z1_9BACL|nr:hypothetical protein [Cohnella luojiensis]TFE30869.1 hypothetical protein E2980_03575 [Cohnella luojiensis]
MTHAAFRQPGCRVRGTDFDEFPGKGVSFSGLRDEGNIYAYRTQTEMRINPITDTPQKKKFVFDSGWDLLALELEEGEFASYTFNAIGEGCTVGLELQCRADAWVSVQQDGREIAQTELSAGVNVSKTIIASLIPAEESIVKVCVHRGRIELHTVCLDVLEN